jgi:hypothetical protein
MNTQARRVERAQVPAGGGGRDVHGLAAGRRSGAAVRSSGERREVDTPASIGAGCETRYGGNPRMSAGSGIVGT